MINELIIIEFNLLNIIQIIESFELDYSSNELELELSI